MKPLWRYLKQLDWVEWVIAVDGFVVVASVAMVIACELTNSPWWQALWIATCLFSSCFALMMFDALQQREARQKEPDEARRYEPPNIYEGAQFVGDDRLGVKHFK